MKYNPHLFVQVFDDSNIFFTSTNRKYKRPYPGANKWSYKELNDNLSRELPPDGFGMRIIRYSLKRIDPLIDYAVVKFPDSDAWGYQEEWGYDKGGKTNLQVFWSSIIIPQHLGILRP